MPADALVSSRAQAVLTAGLLAVSATVPAATGVAAEPDQQQDGTASVEHGVAGDPANSTDFDPGGNATGLPDTASPGARAPASAVTIEDDSGPVDQAPIGDPDDPVVDSGDDSGAAPAGPAAGQSSATPPAPTAPPAAPTVPAPPPAAPDNDATIPAADTSGSTANVDAASPAPVVRAAPNRSHGRQTPRGARVRSTTIGEVDRQARSPVAAHAAVTAPTTVASAEREAARGDRAKPGDRAHTVLAGESLWAIASDLLGGDASPARVAREVQRLWQLNQDRIGTGDPDLLLIGTRLVLR